MVKRRIKDRWHNSTPEDAARDVTAEKNLSEQASALAYIVWRQALNTAINLHAEDFEYENDRQRIAVINEFVAFQIQHIDRLYHGYSEYEGREQLLVGVCENVAEQVQDNLTDIDGPRNYRKPFLELLNDRFSVYSNFQYQEREPSFEVLRYLGHNVLTILGDDQTNRWVIDHVVAIEAPELADQIARSLSRLFSQE
ncbi:MAG: hypothetical protein KTR35_16450 [Gammaproteobacteria bacterium]|nr:hypothetical protein [Gammaproteobacteria bacterium]